MIEKIKDFVFKIQRIIGRTIVKYSSNPRPSTYPYITGDGFRNFADHIYDKTHRHVDVEAIKERDVVFVGDQLIDEFLADVNPRIKARYILVTHNGDSFVDDKSVALAGDKIIKWYGTNMISKHPKAVPLPIGIENKFIYVFGIPWVLKGVIKKNYPKKNRIFYGFTATTNAAERQPALNALKKNPLAETVTKWSGYKTYLHRLATYKFVASPPGSSIEGHRTYDAFYIGIVPIVKSSITNDYFAKLGFPFWKVDDWNELNGFTEAMLEEKFKEIRGNFDSSVLFLDYWTDKIRNAKD